MLSANEIVAQVLSFLILLILLRLFAWKRMLGLLDSRKARIASEFREIEDAKAEIKKLKGDLETKLSAIEEIKRDKIQDGVLEGKGLAEQIRAKAHEDAQDIINNAREGIKNEIASAKEELKNRIVDLTISAAENVIHEKLSEEQDKKLVREFLEKIDKIK